MCNNLLNFRRTITQHRIVQCVLTLSDSTIIIDRAGSSIAVKDVYHCVDVMVDDETAVNAAMSLHGRPTLTMHTHPEHIFEISLGYTCRSCSKRQHGRQE